MAKLKTVKPTAVKPTAVKPTAVKPLSFSSKIFSDIGSTWADGMVVSHFYYKYIELTSRLRISMEESDRDASVPSETIGAGTSWESHLEMVHKIFPTFTEVSVFSITTNTTGRKIVLELIES